MARSARLTNMTSRPIELRFAEKVDKATSQKSWGGCQCHEWRAHVMPNGYGQIRHNGKAVYAHRLAWELANGPIAKGLFVLHRCDNRRCVNLKHLFLGTFYDNMDDMVAKRRQAHGSKNSHAKLTEPDIIAIRASSEKQAVLADIFGVSQPTISEAISGKNHWKFVEKI